MMKKLTLGLALVLGMGLGAATVQAEDRPRIGGAIKAETKAEATVKTPGVLKPLKPSCPPGWQKVQGSKSYRCVNNVAKNFKCPAPYITMVDKPCEIVCQEPPH